MNNKMTLIAFFVILILACGTSSNNSGNSQNRGTTSNDNYSDPISTQSSVDGFSEQLAESGRGGGDHCEGAPAQRVWVDARAYVCTQSDRLIVRENPRRGASEITRIPTGTRMTIIGGPECANSWSWWRVRTDDGVVGWVSEGGDGTDPYFICPLP